MSFFRKSALVYMVRMTMVAMLVPRQAYAITTKKEQEMSVKFKEAVFSYFEVVKDPLSTDYVNRLGQQIMARIPPQPFTYQFYVIKEEQANG